MRPLNLTEFDERDRAPRSALVSPLRSVGEDWWKAPAALAAARSEPEGKPSSSIRLIFTWWHL